MRIYSLMVWEGLFANMFQQNPPHSWYATGLEKLFALQDKTPTYSRCHTYSNKYVEKQQPSV